MSNAISPAGIKKARRGPEQSSTVPGHNSTDSEENSVPSDVDDDDTSEEEKDAAEEELERLVFGDRAGFQEGLRRFKEQDDAELERLSLDDEAQADAEEEEEQDDALATVNDADLFFLDSGPTNAEGPASADIPGSLAHLKEEKDVYHSGKASAWEDSDDERMRVSLMSVPRLRKLRLYEGEDVISGKEYTRRLRKQYEFLHPRPTWADWKENTKKRRRHDSDGEEGSAASDMDIDENDDDDHDEYSTKPLSKLLRNFQPLIRTNQTLNKRLVLRQEVIGIERMKDIAPTQPSPITSLSIHPTLPLVLSSGTSATLYLHHLLPHPAPPDTANPLITSLHLKHTPLSTTAFSMGNNRSQNPQIYLSSRRRYFHTWDLPSGVITKTTRIYGHADTQRSMETLKPSPCGRYIGLLGSTRKANSGIVNILDAKTKQWIAQVRVESLKGVADFAWWGDGEGMCIVGRGGEVSEWRVDERRFVSRWNDEGAVGTTTVALGGSVMGADGRLLGPDRWIAVGSTSGIVNLYDRRAWTGGEPATVLKETEEQGLPQKNPKPTRTFDNLTTPISHLAFSPCGQLFVFASRWKRDALRLAHLPSCTVYRNWPTSKTPLGRISALAVGEYEEDDGRGNGGGKKRTVLCVGNEAGALRGWEVTG